MWQTKYGYIDNLSIYNLSFAVRNNSYIISQARKVKFFFNFRKIEGQIIYNFPEYIHVGTDFW